ncbi:MerR-like DNA binding protein [Kribbella amoyensis]|uniref:MerR-like DNA binding protein n=1 Tax=Kribbella amoyensis TaxID=996641 RepID=A0A561C0A4_9ACTN|nr:MerR family transcriptional regulator [Kribbella amoyensis]TWD84571.1 MerR-like DNA binding protein [Kribbella amoyensis]
MASLGSAPDDVSRAATVLPVGRVSALLGIPAVTLRTWESRYGIGPSARTSGLHRRYTVADVDRLRRMQELIGRGLAARDAAVLIDQDAAGRPDADGSATNTELLLSATESLRTTELDDLLQNCLDQRGAAQTWTEVVAPAFRRLEARFAGQGDCTDLELLLSRTFEATIERYVYRRGLRPSGGRPTILVHCPEERHTLPLTVLRAVLLERSQPVLTLGPETTTFAVRDFVRRVNPAAVVLWASITRPGQAELRRRVADGDHRTYTAGPGWPPHAEPFTNLSEAAATLTVRRSARLF